jgi:hypothetical protein
MNFLSNFERLILGTFAKGSEHLEIKLTHCIFTNMLCFASVVKYIFF